jgi:hypothetical protein
MGWGDGEREEKKTGGKKKIQPRNFQNAKTTPIGLLNGLRATKPPNYLKQFSVFVWVKRPFPA